MYLGSAKVKNMALARPFEMKELLVALKIMKFRKVPGNDKMPVEVFCLIESEYLLDELLVCFNSALQTGVVESGMRDVIITTLFKKGSPLLCDNYRTLSLINHMGKVLEKMIQIRVGHYCELVGCLPESQHGFRNDRSTVDAMFMSRLLSSSAREKMVPIYKVFVDLTKAYDKVNRTILWKALDNIGIPGKLINLIKGLLVGSKADIRIKGKIVNGFNLDSGLKQGSVFSPLLFNLFFGAIIDAWQVLCEGKGIPLMFKIGGNFLSLDSLTKLAGVKCVCVSDLLFADDAEIVASSAEDLQYMLDKFVEVTSAFGQEVSVKKTKVMVVHKRLLRKEELVFDLPLDIKVNGQSLENVDVFTYVGGKENTHGNMDDEVKVRLSEMSAAFAALSERVFLNSNIHLVTKLRIFDTVVISNGLYGCATWNITDAQIRKLESWKFRHLKKMLKYKWSDYCSYVDILDRIRSYDINIGTMEMTIRKRRLLYLGHVIRMEDVRLPKMMLFGSIDLGKKVAGGQETSYRKCIKSDLKVCHMSDDTLIDSAAIELLALDKKEWVKRVNLGVEVLYKDWACKRMDESYYRHFESLLLQEKYLVEFPTQEEVYDSWMVLKNGPFWRIESNDIQRFGASWEITVRGRGRKHSALRLFEKSRKKNFSPFMPEMSRVTRILAEIRKNE